MFCPAEVNPETGSSEGSKEAISPKSLITFLSQVGRAQRATTHHGDPIHHRSAPPTSVPRLTPTSKNSGSGTSIDGLNTAHSPISIQIFYFGWGRNYVLGLRWPVALPSYCIANPASPVRKEGGARIRTPGLGHTRGPVDEGGGSATPPPV